MNDNTAPTTDAIAAYRNFFSRMYVTIVPRIRPTSTAPFTERLQALIDDACSVECFMTTLSADVPAALSALSIKPLAHCARLGRMAATTATACKRGTAWNACAPISNPM